MKYLLLFFLLPSQIFAQSFSQSEIKRWKQQAQRVTIIRDNWGVPHIYGKTDADAVFGLLYAQCEDDFKRVEANYIEKLGRKAEVAGESELYNDLYLRLVIDSAEAVADYNLWIWHNAFGFPGSMNDINIWDRSPLLESMLDGTHENIDFPFTIGSEEFDQLYYCVDGIYPSLSRFLATINGPTTVLDSFYAPKQEGWRKSIERAFGVWKKKFLSVGVKCMLYHREDMFYLAIATIVMHNMMVEERVHN